MNTAGTPPHRPRLAALAWLPGPLATGLGLAAHVLGGGASPAPLIVVALAALLGMAAAIGRPWRLPGWGLLLLSGVVQQVLHLAFAAFSVSTGVDLPTHGHGSAPAADTGGGGAQATAPHDLHLLLYLHMGAALVTAWATGRLARAAAKPAALTAAGPERA